MPQKHRQRVCVIGVGFVGEQLLKTFRRHYTVLGVDTSAKRVACLRVMYPYGEFQTTYDGIEDSDVFLIAVPTLVEAGGSIDMSYITTVRDGLRDIARQGALVVVESSVYIGATRELFGEFLARGVHVGFSPERVDPGRVEPRAEDIPKLVAGLDECSLQRMQHVYQPVFRTVVPVSSVECAEMCKLYENCFRMVNIAYVNEIADMCAARGIDVHEMIRASATKPFGFMPFTPGLGVGGHCIPVNPHYLMRGGNTPLPVLSMSTELMKQRPKKKADELVKRWRPESVLVMGIGFKPGEASTVNSPGYEAYTHLRQHVPSVIAYDPVVEQHSRIKGVRFLSKADFTVHQLIQRFDCVWVVHAPNDDHKHVLNEYAMAGGRVVKN